MSSPFHWRGTPSQFAQDRAFNGQNAAISDRTRLTKEAQPVVLRGSISVETKVSQQDKRWKLLGAGR